MENKIKAGDVVRLKSGGCKMTVQYLVNDNSGRERAMCTWSHEPSNEIKSLDIVTLALDVIPH